MVTLLWSSSWLDASTRLFCVEFVFLLFFLVLAPPRGFSKMGKKSKLLIGASAPRGNED